MGAEHQQALRQGGNESAFQRRASQSTCGKRCLIGKSGRAFAAILPLGMKGKEILPGWKVSWSEEIRNEFAGTSISVVILTAEREV